MFNFKRVATVAAFAVSAFGIAGSANAAEFMCTPAPGQCSFDGTTGGYSNVKRAAGETASDIFHILVDAPGQLILTFTTAKLTFDSATFAGVTFSPVAGQEYLFNIATAGTYDLLLTVSNPTSTVASYSGTIDVAAVPEPAMWGMMIGGFAMGGMALRRRRSTAAAVA
ncbi:FxDxF family PEP-CTERM protein [Sphingomonas sp. RS6]